MKSLTEKLSHIVGQAFEKNQLPIDLGAVHVSDRPDLAQFQCNGAMAAAKIAKSNPREIAQKIVDRLQEHDIFKSISLAGPGFINLDITDEYLSAHLKEFSKSENFYLDNIGQNTDIILDYGGPNIAKPMHVGHLRASIIGDALRRIHALAGYNAIGDVHTGDWGTHLGMLFNDYEAEGKTQWLLGLDPNNEQDLQTLFEDLAERYPKASAACKSDPELMAAAHKVTKAMQDHQSPYIEMWRIIYEASIKGMKENFDSLGVHFDLWNGEASVHDLIAPMVEELKKKNIAENSDGALVVHTEQPDDKKEMPPLILYKSDGAVMYGTTDLATLVERMEEYDPVHIIYVVDQRQSLHFEQVFRVARKANIVPETTKLTHAGFGTMNGTDGKPFKTRAGGVMKLEDLIASGILKAHERLNDANISDEIGKQEREDIARKVALAAIKFADLQNQRQSDYVFDIDRMMAFEGKTGPYLLYQAVRIKSLLDKAGIKESDLTAHDYSDLNNDLILEDEDRALALLLTELPDQFENALNNLTPHVLCDYAYRLAQQFSKFYAACHILSEENEALRSSRLALCALTFRQLKLVLGVLGIEIPARM